jgi:hypothetical protein
MVFTYRNEKCLVSVVNCCWLADAEFAEAMADIDEDGSGEVCLRPTVFTNRPLHASLYLFAPVLVQPIYSHDGVFA